LDVAEIVGNVKWLVPGWVPRSLITGLFARPKDGKSFWALQLAWSIATGRDFLTGIICAEPAKVIWADTEGNSGINIQRARKWGVPMHMLIAPFQDDPLKPINLEDREHIQRISDVICCHQAPLLVIDSYRGSHRNDENSSQLMGALQSLAKIGQETKTAPLLLHHASDKIPYDVELTSAHVRGSSVYTQMVRSLIAIERGNLKNDWRRVRLLNQNLGAAPEPYGFRITDTGLEFGDAPEIGVSETRKQDCIEWFRKTMKPNREYIASQIQEQAKDAGFRHTTVQSAREAIGLTRKAGNVYPRPKDGKYVWRLPSPV
jgi:hypothetical protein